MGDFVSHSRVFFLCDVFVCVDGGKIVGVLGCVCFCACISGVFCAGLWGGLCGGPVAVLRSVRWGWVVSWNGCWAGLAHCHRAGW